MIVNWIKIVQDEVSKFAGIEEALDAYLIVSENVTSIHKYALSASCPVKTANWVRMNIQWVKWKSKRLLKKATYRNF